MAETYPQRENPFYLFQVKRIRYLSSTANYAIIS
jgi:hypothetical protein